MEPFDPTKPNIARVWDYWLGGKDNFAADRKLAEELLTIMPVSAKVARENRHFLRRAVDYVAAHGVEQFVDVGAGLPTALNTHDIAQRVVPDARVAYVDHDPIVIAHARSLLSGSPEVIAVPGDIEKPEEIIDDRRLNKLIDLGEPVCVILCAVLHFVNAETAREVTEVFIRAMAPGSYVIISVGWADQVEGSRFTSAYTAGSAHIHSLEEIRSFFGELELVGPGIVPVRAWRGDEPPGRIVTQRATFRGGVGRLP